MSGRDPIHTAELDCRLQILSNAFQPVSTAMGDHTEALPFIVASSRPLKWKQRLFTLGYATMVAVAMIGWCTALGWAAISLVGRMLS
jgi:hypothetical protein